MFYVFLSKKQGPPSYIKKRLETKTKNKWSLVVKHEIHGKKR